jgi:hypothetical protein
MKNFIQNFKIWLDWRKRIKGVEVIDWRRGCGYYLGLFKTYQDRIIEAPLPSGKVGIYKLLDVIYYYDPYDMIKESYWQLLGYKGEKKFNEMTFLEYKTSRLDSSGNTSGSSF